MYKKEKYRCVRSDLALALSGMGLPGYRGPLAPMDPPTPTPDEAAENVARRITTEIAGALGRLAGKLNR